MYLGVFHALSSSLYFNRTLLSHSRVGVCIITTPTYPSPQDLAKQDSLHSMLSAYQRHWLNYQLGAKFLNNLFGYFNRVSLKKYQINEETTDYALPAILQPPVATPPPGTPVEIRNVCGAQLNFLKLTWQMK